MHDYADIATLSLSIGGTSENSSNRRIEEIRVSLDQEQDTRGNSLHN